MDNDGWKNMSMSDELHIAGWCERNEAALALVLQMRTLRGLSLYNMYEVDPLRMLIQLREPGALEYLCIGHTLANDKTMGWIAANCHRLKDLIINDTVVGAHGIEVLSALTELTVLDCSSLRLVNPRPLPVLGRLELLIARRMTIPQEWAEGLPRMPRLRTVNLRGSVLSDGVLDLMSRSRSLERLNMDGCWGISNLGVTRLLRAATALRELRLDAVLVSADVLEAARQQGCVLSY